MGAKYNKIKASLLSQYADYKMQKDGFYGECYKDFDRTSPHESMRKAFERGMDNYSNVIEDAIKVWAKEHGMNGSATLGQIMCNIDVNKIKLK